MEARPHRDDAVGRMDRDRDLPMALAERLLQALQAAQIAGQLAQAPLLGERFLQPLQVAGRRVHVGRLDLDVVQPHHRIELDRADLGALPDHLLVHLAVGRHVDDHVAEQLRLTGQAAVRRHLLAARAVALLGRARRRDVRGARADAVLGELALGQGDLATAAQRPAAAHRIDVDPELARRLEQGRAAREPPAAPGRRENDEGSVSHPVGAQAQRALEPDFKSKFPPSYARRRRRSRRSLALGARLAVRLQPAPAIAIVAHQHVGALDRAGLLGVQRVHDRRGHAGADRHGQEAGVHGMPIGQAEADVRCAAGGVDLELLAQPADQVKGSAAGVAQSADRHDQRIDHHVGARDAVVLGALDDLLGDLEAHVRVLGDAGLVVGDGHDRGAVLPDQRQHALEALVLAGDRVDQRLAAIDREPGLERGDDRGVDRERHVDQRLHQLHGLGEDARLVRERNAGVDVQHVRAGRDLRERIGLDLAVVARRHLRRQPFASGRIDPLADDAERLLEADHDLLGGGADHRVGHAGRSSLSGSRPPFATRSRRRSGG